MTTTTESNKFRLLSQLPEDALGCVKDFIQDVKKPLFFAVRGIGDYTVFKIAMYKQEFKIDLCTDDLKIDLLTNPLFMNSFPMYFKTKKTLAIFLHNYYDSDREYEYKESDECSNLAISLDYKTVCCTRICLVNKNYTERKSAIRDTIEDYADMIVEGHN